MPVGISIALERELAGVSPDAFAGRALNAARWELSEAAEAAGFEPLEEFVSLSPEESEILAGDLNFDADVDAASPAGWFDAGAGLSLVRALRQCVRSDPDGFPDAGTLAGELDALAEVLEAASQAGVRFRLSVAY